MINNDTIPLSNQDTINWIKNQNKQKIKQEPTKVNNETNAPTVYGKYVDKCLNEAAKHFFSKGEDKYSVADLFYAGVRCGKSWLEKQYEQKSFNYENINIQQKDFAPKVEPKFKVGDWISHDTANFVFQVVSLGSCGYEVINRENYTKAISFDNEENYHLWTIKDAKDGDILATKDGRPFIFKDFSDINHPNAPTAYCGINTLDNFISGVGCAWWTDEEVFPATKEQRDLLFKKMKEAGYKWENNQLEKIDNNEDVVDLGLPSGTLWAKCNLGAEEETDFGKFFQWGDTQGYSGVDEHRFNWDDYKWGISWENMAKYNKTDGKLALDNEDDPIFVASNGEFKMPTKEQWQELIDHTNHEWTTIDGVRGIKFINKKDDTKYIFIPAAGGCSNSSHIAVGSWGYVWSASRDESNVDDAWGMSFGADGAHMCNYGRCIGCSVRGVLNK